MQFCFLNYRSRALKSRSKSRAAIRLRAAFGNFLLYKNSSLFTMTLGEKVLTLAKSRGFYVRGYGIHIIYKIRTAIESLL